MLDERRDIMYGVGVLGSADAFRGKGKGGGSFGGLLLVLLSILSSFLLVSLYHNPSAAAIPWKKFKNASLVPGE